MYISCTCICTCTSTEFHTHLHVHVAGKMGDSPLPDFRQNLFQHAAATLKKKHSLGAYQCAPRDQLFPLPNKNSCMKP